MLRLIERFDFVCNTCLFCYLHLISSFSCALFIVIKMTSIFQSRYSFGDEDDNQKFNWIKKIFNGGLKSYSPPHHQELCESSTSTPTISTCTTATNLSSQNYQQLPRSVKIDINMGRGGNLHSNLALNQIEPLNPSKGDLSPGKTEAGDANKTKRNFTFSQILTSISVSFVSMQIGFASAYTSPAAETLSRDLNIRLDGSEYSWICSLMPLFALIGGLIGGQMIDYFGRKRSIVCTNVLFMFAWILCGIGSNIWMVYIARCLTGLSVGVASLALPVYLGETIQPEVRGTLGLLPTAFGNTGILLCFTIGSYVDWKWLAWVGLAFAVPFMLLLCVIKESPRWYISKGKKDEAQKALSWLRADGENVDKECEEMCSSMHNSDKDTSYISDLFSKRYGWPLMISLLLMLFQQMSGINAVIFYTTTIFKMAGSTIDTNLCTIIVGVVNFISTFFATVLIDRLGRKVLLYISSIAMTITLVTLGSYFYVKEVVEYDVSSVGWLPLASFVLYVLGFSLGFGPIPWLMLGEILPSKIRGTAASLATSFNWSCTFLITKTFVDMINLLGKHGTFWSFGGCTSIALVFVIFCVPETRGKSLEDIEAKFVRRVSSTANFKLTPTGA